MEQGHVHRKNGDHVVDFGEGGYVFGVGNALVDEFQFLADVPHAAGELVQVRLYSRQLVPEVCGYVDVAARDDGVGEASDHIE
uniref:Uncharacterized protein n=1 Tax=viral metagenome TaxID=1070528 RepID=A0A6C0K8J2_9ZZZZ